MGILKEFKEFAVKGNVVDMAVGVIIGAAFGKIVSSAVADVVTPPLGLLVGGVDFSGLELVIRAAEEGKDAVVIKYGVFLQATFDFLIVAAVIFVVVKAINRLKRTLEHAPPEAPPVDAPPPEPSDEVKLLTEIRNLLRDKG